MTTPAGGGVGSTGPEVTEQPPVETPNLLDQPRAAAGSTPGPEAVIKPGKPSADSSPSDDPENQPGEPEGGSKDDPLSPDEEKQLGELRDRATRQSSGQIGTIRMKVELPHSAMTHAGATIGPDWTEVPAWLGPILASAAADAGVKITQQDEES
jgi:hypothetical protein